MIALGLAAAIVRAQPASAPVVPTPAQLAWSDSEIGAIVQYNIGLYGELTNNYACNKGLLPASAFAPGATLDTDAWAAAAKQFGAKYAVLTTQAGCGYLLWPTNSTIATGAR